MLKPVAICAAILMAMSAPAFAEEAAQGAPVADSAAAASAPAVSPPKTDIAAASANDDVPQAVKDACKGDYEKHCSMHAPESNEVRECMARAFEKLSDGCVTAILDSSLADQQQATVEDAKPQPAAHKVGSTATAKQKSRNDTRNLHASAKEPKPKTMLAETRAAKKKAQHAAAGNSRKQIAKADKAPGKRTYASVERRTKKKSVADYIKKGTGIANYYVSKYTRFALAKAFR